MLMLHARICTSLMTILLLSFCTSTVSAQGVFDRLRERMSDRFQPPELSPPEEPQITDDVLPAPGDQESSVEGADTSLPPVVSIPAERPSLGVVAEEQADDQEGLKVVEVKPESSAADAGMLIGDIIIALNGEVVDGIDDVARMMSSLDTRKPIQIEIRRGGQRLELAADLWGILKTPPKQAVTTPETPGRLGVRVDDARNFQSEVEQGAYVVAVTPGAPAEAAGLQRGDIIVSIDGEAIADADALFRVMSTTQAGQQIRIGLIRNGVVNDQSVTLGATAGTVSAPTGTPGLFGDQPTGPSVESIIGGVGRDG